MFPLGTERREMELWAGLSQRMFDLSGFIRRPGTAILVLIPSPGLSYCPADHIPEFAAVDSEDKMVRKVRRDTFLTTYI
jgi:hypothetical protein